MFVDDSVALRRLVTLLLEEEPAVRCLSFASLAAVQAASEDVLGSCLAVIDINLGEGKPDGVAVYEWLKSNGFRGRSFFFTGHAKDSPQVIRAAQTGLQILEKPMTPEELLLTLKRAIVETGERSAQACS